MTQTKLEIIGPYTPEHEGPFCTRDGRSVRVLCSDMQNDYSIVAIVEEEDGRETVSTFLDGGQFSRSGEFLGRDLMNAREVPVAREFWINRYPHDDSYYVYKSEDDARESLAHTIGYTIHVREVLPGEGA